MHRDEFTIHFNGQIFQLVALYSHWLFQSHVVLVLAEHALDLLGIVINTLETVLGFQFGVFGQFLLEAGVIFLFIQETRKLAQFGNQVELLHLLIFFSAEFALVHEEGLLGVGNSEVVPLLVVFDQSLRRVVDLHVVHGTLGEVEVSHLVNAVVSVIRNDRLANNFLLDFVFFPSFFL